MAVLSHLRNITLINLVFTLTLFFLAHSLSHFYFFLVYSITFYRSFFHTFLSLSLFSFLPSLLSTKGIFCNCNFFVKLKWKSWFERNTTLWSIEHDTFEPLLPNLSTSQIFSIYIIFSWKIRHICHYYVLSLRVIFA